MPRPSKCRIIKEEPKFSKFKPACTKVKELEQLILTVDEYEAIRLADFEEMYQEKAAQAMGVSRQTFGNIVKSGRKKMAEMLVLGKALNIEGGDVSFLNKACPKCKKKNQKCPKHNEENDESLCD